MNLLVTGASGFIGKNFLLSVPADWDVKAVYNSSVDFPHFLESHGLRHIQPVRVDLGSGDDPGGIRALGSQFDMCVFLAANGDPAFSTGHPAVDLASNAMSVVRLLEEVSVRRFVFFSSGAVYDGLKGAVSPASHPRPALPYAISKLAAEQYLQFFQHRGQISELTLVRFFGAYGPHEPPRKIYTRLVTRFAIERNPRFVIKGDGKNLIDAMHISDAVRAIHLLLAKSSSTGTVDLCHGRPLTLSALVQEAASTFGITPEILYEGAVPEYIEFLSCDRTMKTEFGFEPVVTLREGLTGLHQHLQSQISR
jgi:nucleoside-diphosphate-sugar epimerase